MGGEADLPTGSEQHDVHDLQRGDAGQAENQGEEQSDQVVGHVSVYTRVPVDSHRERARGVNSVTSVSGRHGG
jgi:hypothetical protein